MKARLSLFVLLLSLSAASAGQTSPQTLKVTASGEGSGGSTMSQEQVKAIALADARRMALEQAGTAIWSSTEVVNFELSRDQIQAYAQGLVRLLSIKDSHCSYDDSLKAMHCRVTIEAEVETYEARELLDRLSQSLAQEQRTGQPELGVSFRLLPFRPAPAGARGIRIKAGQAQEYQLLELLENGVLESGDEFQLRLTPDQDAWVYVVSVDSHQQVFAMLPHPEGRSDNHLSAGTSYILPGEGKYYQLDDKPGPETIYLIAARQRMPDIEYLLARALAASDAQAADPRLAELVHASAVGARGVSGITQGDPVEYQLQPGVSVKDIEELIQGQGSVVRVFRYRHE